MNPFCGSTFCFSSLQIKKPCNLQWKIWNFWGFSFLKKYFTIKVLLKMCWTLIFSHLLIWPHFWSPLTPIGFIFFTLCVTSWLVNICFCKTFDTECVMDLDYQNELLIFESILTSFKLSIIFGGSWGSTENWLKPKNEPPSGNLSCPNLWNAL